MAHRKMGIAVVGQVTLRLLMARGTAYGASGSLMVQSSQLSAQSLENGEPDQSEVRKLAPSWAWSSYLALRALSFHQHAISIRP